MQEKTTYQALCEQARGCQLCKNELPSPPNPIFIWPPEPNIILISQAPGRLAHQSNIAWNDASGDRLRDWLGIDRATFYDAGSIAVLPMSFCFPGYKNGADAPPIKICAPTWHPRFLAQANPVLTIYVGRYAQASYLPQYRKLTDAVADYQNLLPNKLALPHPSGRNNRWLSQHAWFKTELVPLLRLRINDLV